MRIGVLGYIYDTTADDINPALPINYKEYTIIPTV